MSNPIAGAPKGAGDLASKGDASADHGELPITPGQSGTPRRPGFVSWQLISSERRMAADPIRGGAGTLSPGVIGSTDLLQASERQLGKSHRLRHLMWCPAPPSTLLSVNILYPSV
jgi:hypothetical protein